MLTLEDHSSYLDDAWAAARDAPLSVRKAMLVAMLIDAQVDRLFAAGNTGAEDVLAYRAGLAMEHEALGLVLALAATRDGGPRLLVEAVEVPIAEYHRLSVQDYMVSLYNGNSVQRVRVAVGETRRDAHEVLAAAMGVMRG